MASLPFSPLILGISISLIFISLFSPSDSATTCTSQKLPSNNTYANCTVLPTLNATLHFNYSDTNRSLAVAFSAAPATTDGWVAWGINPAGGRMVGSQAFIAYKLNGNVAVNLYNLTSYKGIDEVKKLSFDTWDVSAVDTNGVITIFATIKVPEKANLSQVWQVGPVSGGKPSIHKFDKENLSATEALQVGTTAVETGNTTSGSGTGSGGGNSTAGGDKSGAMVIGGRFGLGFYLGLVLVLLTFMSM